MEARSEVRGTLIRATAVGTVLQVAMVVAGHFIAPILALFAPLGMAISLVAGLLFAKWAGRSGKWASARGGAVVGGACALLGIAVSIALRDAPLSLLALGTGSSMIAGAVGGLAGHRMGAAAPETAGA